MFKRFLRVYPFYWVISALVVIAFIAIPSLGDGLPSGMFILKSILLLPQEKMPLVIVAWTLVHEVFFYLLFGVLILFPRIGISIMGIWCCGILFSVISGVKWNYLFEFLFNLHNIEFLLGMLIAFLIRFRLPLYYFKILMWLGFFLFILTGMEDIHSRIPNPDLLIIYYALSSCLIIFGMVSCELVSGFNMSKWVIFIGRASYSIYLVNFLALSFFAKFMMLFDLGHCLPLWVIFWILVCLTTITGIFFYVYIERPMHEMLRQRLQAR